MTLLDIGQQLTVYGGLCLLLIGILGNGINIFIFSSIRTYRTTPCTFYFLIASIFNIVYITINLISRIVSVGFGIDLTRTSISWCKARNFFLLTLSLITLTCSCLATIDQFLAASRNVHLRHFSRIKLAHQIVFVMIIVWCLHEIPPLLFYHISPITNTCVNSNAAFAIYIPIYLLALVCAIPVSVMVVFGCLTYRNIHQTRALAEQHADRQLASMTLIQVVFVVIFITPYGINNAYSLITSNIVKDTNRLIEESFALTVLSLITYFYYVVCLKFFC
jgi:hypothetical protein